MSLNIYRAGQIIKHRNSIAEKAARAISQLNAAVNEAVEFSIFMEENPSNDFDDGEKAEIRSDFQTMLSDLNEVLPKIELLNQMSKDDITVEQFRSANNKNSFNSAEYRKKISK